VAVEEQPGVAIIHEAKPPAIDVVALETHGRRGLSRLMLGSVADKVIRGATVPVLVHRPVHP
jgi:nucleotide-binding universal stress UspA family protein